MNNVGIMRYLVLVVALAGLLPSLLTAFFFFPMNYGWWPFYSYMEQNGFQMYDDFNTVYPPLFIRLIQFFSYVGFEPWKSLAFGVARVFILFGLAVYVMKRFTSLNIAAFAAFLIVITQIRSPVFLPDDYHIFQRTLFFIGIAIYVVYFDCKPNERRALTLAAALAAFCALFIFAKQNIGVLLSFGVLIALIRDAVTKNADWKVPALFAVTFTVSIPLFAFLLGITVDQLFGISFGNDSKGSLFTIATNLVSKPHNISLLQKGVILVSVFIACILLVNAGYMRDVASKLLTTELKNRLLPILMMLALPAGLIVFIRYSQT